MGDSFSFSLSSLEILQVGVQFVSEQSNETIPNSSCVEMWQTNVCEHRLSSCLPLIPGFLERNLKLEIKSVELPVLTVGHWGSSRTMERTAPGRAAPASTDVPTTHPPLP